jgi:hypothetical protein
MRKFTSAHAKNHFGERSTRLGRRGGITKYDRPVVVMVAVEEFDRMKAMGASKATQSANVKPSPTEDERRANPHDGRD